MSGLVHIGAWDGMEYIAETRPMILFEPQAHAFTRLKRNLGPKQNVILVNVALGAKPGTAEMHLSEPSHSSSILAPKKQLALYPEITFNGATETVRVSTLDAEMKGLVGFDEMVIDVQGYELEVFKGARKTLKRIRQITSEVNLDEVYEGCALVGDLDKFLADFDFKRVKTTLHTRGMCGDAVYVK